MDWLEHKYVNILSTRLRNFKRRGGTINFSCPICGDSASNKAKARGFIFEKQGKSRYYCHNCGASLTVPNFIKTVDSVLYNEYKLEKLKSDGNKSQQLTDLQTFVDKMKKPVFLQSGPLKGLKKVSQLSHNHPVKKFVADRKIPNEYHAKLFSCPNFFNYTNSILPDKFSAEACSRDEERLIIPFFSRDKTVHAFQGRAIGGKGIKYITIVLNDTIPKIYGLDTLKDDQDIIVVEGPIDSMFLRNAIATAGGDLVAAVRGFPKTNLTIVYDNEPRNPETVKKIDKAIMNGYSVCIWPQNLEHKDINDMVLAGLSTDFIHHIIKTNTYRDLAAKLALSKWSMI